VHNYTSYMNLVIFQIPMKFVPHTHTHTHTHGCGIFTFKNLHNAYKSCLEGKVNAQSASEFTEHLERNLLVMTRDLANRTYKVGQFTCFPITDPKLREVWAADFRDRIIHHLFVSQIEARWEKVFIYDSYACRTEKGAHKAVRKIKREVTPPGMLYLHVDIRGFFTSIDKDILFAILSKKIKHPDLVYLMKLIIFHDPKSNYVIRGNERLLHDIPAHKSLFKVPNGKGLPIGNYTSQFFANVYLNELDQYAKRILKCRHYFRYMDDVLIIDRNQNHLCMLAKQINLFLHEKLKIELHPKKTILQRADTGIDFLGYVIHPEYSLSRKRVVGNVRKKLAYFNKQLSKIQGGVTSRNEEIEQVVRNAQAVINSYWGHFKHANCGKLKEKLYEKHFDELKKYLELSKLTRNHFIIKNGVFPEKK